MAIERRLASVSRIARRAPAIRLTSIDQHAIDLGRDGLDLCLQPGEPPAHRGDTLL